MAQIRRRESPTPGTNTEEEPESDEVCQQPGSLPGTVIPMKRQRRGSTEEDEQDSGLDTIHSTKHSSLSPASLRGDIITQNENAESSRSEANFDESSSSVSMQAILRVSEPSQPSQLSVQQSSLVSNTEATSQIPSLPHRDSDIREPEPGSSLPFQYPPEQWRYNKLLVDISNMIETTKELDTMKYRFRGLFTQGVIDEITKPMDLFRKLEQRNFLNQNNILYLQAIVQDLNRPELIKTIIDYCLSSDILHFQPATDKPVNGYKHIKFHLHLDKEYTLRDIRDLQSMVADILCVDRNFVSVAGVEPSRSLLVTFMLPEMYVDILQEYLDENLLQDQFAELGIDTITIDQQVYELKEHQRSEAVGLLRAGTTAVRVAQLYGTVKDQPLPGRPKITTRRQDDNVRRLYRRSPMRPATVTANRTIGLHW